MAGERDGQAILQGTVICWILPITRATRERNRRERVWPSREWALTRNYGEKFNNVLRLHVVAFLSERGHRAFAPQLSPEGHDKPKCREYVHGDIPRAVGERFNVSEIGCVLCQTMVPCEGMIPRGKGRPSSRTGR